MEEDWQRFTMTGKIQDYLSYCSERENSTQNKEQAKQTGEMKDGTDGNSAWNGNSRISHGRI